MAYGCGGIFLSVFIVGLILTIIEFVKAYSMIVFGNKSKLKYIPENKSLTSIHEICNLEIELVKKMQAEQIFYSAETIDDWCRMLLPYTQLSEEEKKAHVERITKKFGKIN